MKTFKTIVSLFMISALLLPSSVLGATTSDWDLVLVQGEWKSATFSVLDAGKNCTLMTADLDGIEQFLVADSIPSEISFNSSAVSIKPYIAVPSTATAGIYRGDIRYCETKIRVYLTVENKQAKSPLDDVRVNYYGSPTAGSTLLFYVSNITSKAGMEAVITVRSLLAGIPSQVLTCNGYCSPNYDISPNERGQIIAEVTIPSISKSLPPIAITITGDSSANTTSTKEITVSGYGEWSLDSSVQYLIIGGNQPMKYAEISIVGPSGYSFSGTTNNNGIVVDSSGKIFGSEVKPDKIGQYTMFIQRDGFIARSYNFEIIKLPCPTECCASGIYEEKLCQTDYECSNGNCTEISKPKLTITCSSNSPKQFDTITCSAFKEDDTIFSENFQGTLKYNSNVEPLIFSNGQATISLDKQGSFMITVGDILGYKGDSFTANVSPKGFGLDWEWHIYAIVLAGLSGLVVLVYRAWKSGKEPKKSSPFNLAPEGTSSLS